MLNRSDIDLAGISTGGENLGTGIGVFKEKNMSGNTLQFKTLCATGGLSIVTGDTELTIVGTTGITVSGASNYVLKINGAGDNVETSSIYDSGTTATDNLHIYRYNLVLGGNTVDSCKITIKPLIDRKIELIASSGVNIGDLDACVCIGHGHAGFTGLTLLAAGHYDLLLHAGSCTAANCSGKNLLLSGGDGNGTGVGGNVVLTGGTGSVSGNIILSTPTGKIKMCNLPPKTTETCGLYIDSNGNLSKGIVLNSITGTSCTMAVYNTSGNLDDSYVKYIEASRKIVFDDGTASAWNICARCGDVTAAAGAGLNVCAGGNYAAGTNSAGNLTLSAGDNNTASYSGGQVYISPGIQATTGTVGTIYLGKSTYTSSSVMLTPAGTQANIGVMLRQKGSGAITIGCGSSGTVAMFGNMVSVNNGIYLIGNSCIQFGSCVDSSITGSAPASAGAGCALIVKGGSGYASGNQNGGNLVLCGGAPFGTGTSGRIKMCTLPLKTTETCGIYIDASNNLSYGIISGGTGGGGLSVAVTGSTNGITTINSRCVCLGGSITGANLLCAPTASDSLNFCSINGINSNKTIIGNGVFNTCTCCASTSFCGCISNVGQIILSSCNPTNSSCLDITPNCITMVGSTSSCIKTTPTFSCMYNFSTGSIFNTIAANAQNAMLMSVHIPTTTSSYVCLNSATQKLCLVTVNPSCSTTIDFTPNIINICGCAGTFAGLTYDINYCANYTARSLVDCGYVNTRFAPINNAVHTGTLTTPIIKITTGAAAGCVLTSAADGTASWTTPSGGGGVSYCTGTDVNNRVITATGDGKICGESNLTFDGSTLNVTGTIVATSTITATDFILSSDRKNKENIEAISIAPINIEYKQFNFICEPNQLRYGVIAQELQQVNPELVRESENGLGVAYTDLLIKEVAFLKCEVKELRAIINNLK